MESKYYYNDDNMCKSSTRIYACPGAKGLMDKHHFENLFLKATLRMSQPVVSNLKVEFNWNILVFNWSLQFNSSIWSAPTVCTFSPSPSKTWILQLKYLNTWTQYLKTSIEHVNTSIEFKFQLLHVWFFPTSILILIESENILDIYTHRTVCCHFIFTHLNAFHVYFSSLLHVIISGKIILQDNFLIRWDRTELNIFFLCMFQTFRMIRISGFSRCVCFHSFSIWNDRLLDMSEEI
jgi:hypothetical protein